MSTPKDVAIQLSEAIARSDWSTADSLIDKDFTYVADARPAIGKAEYLAFMRNVLCAAMGEMNMKFTRVVTEGNLVALEYTNTMIHKGTFCGIPATGRRVTATGHLIREVKDGKVVGEWQTTNALGLLSQLAPLANSVLTQGSPL